MLLISAIVRKVRLLLPVLAIFPTLDCQQVKTLEWRLEQQPTTAPCSPDDIAFATAPEQLALEKSYGVIQPPGRECESIKATAFNGARVLHIIQPSLIDDGEAYALIQPKGASSARLIPIGGGGTLFWGKEDDWHNRAAMNAVLQTSDPENLEDADWLAISLAYLAILGEEPTLNDLHYSPGPTEHFTSYTVSGLLKEVPSLRSKHLLPTAKCGQSACEVRFYYRTEPIMPLKAATFRYTLNYGSIWLHSVQVVDYPDRSRKKQGTRR